MKAYSTCMKMKEATVLSAILFSFLLLQGCGTPLVAVNVAVVPEGGCGPDSTEGIGAGGCYPLGATGHSANGFQGVGGASPVGNQTCGSGTYCGQGGTCMFGKKCTSFYNYSTSQCNCGCM